MEAIYAELKNDGVLTGEICVKGFTKTESRIRKFTLYSK